MKIAFLVLAHTDPKQLQRLVKALNFKCNTFVHLDKKTDMRPFSNIQLPKNAQFIQERVGVDWAGFNMIKATLSLIKAALDSNEQYSHLVLLSGLDYPIKPVNELHSFLTNSKPRQHIKFFDIEDSSSYYINRARKYWFYDRWIPRYDRIVRKYLAKFINLIIKKPLLKNIKHSYGSQWWAITPACAGYILKYVERNKKFVKWHQTSVAPDETFFHTIIANSPFLNETLGFEKFTGRGVYKMANLHVIHPSTTKIYDEKDFDQLERSDMYFVRKVTTKNSFKLLNLIDTELLHPKVTVSI